MKLEIKYLASYLPYDLKGINYLKDISTLGIKDEVFTYTNFYENKNIKEKFTYLSINSFLNEKYKPILFPLSSLTKEITINGETFIPIEVIMKSIGINGEMTIDDEPCFGWDESYGDDAQGYAVCFSTEKLFFGVCYWEDIYEGIFTDKMLYELPFEYKQFQKLLEWKIDVFGLIELGLAEPVTEDFNPYK